MEPKIEIYDDYCVDMGSKDIQTILSQITALVTDAVLRATAQQNKDDAAYLYNRDVHKTKSRLGE